MRVLVVGSGGREHALAWKLATDPQVERVLAAPGSAGMAKVAECVGIRADDVEGLGGLALERGIDLTVVGPEAPLAAGIADHFRAAGLRIFGPGRDGARLEASKVFTKELLLEAGIETARHGVFTNVAAARDFARDLGFPVVVKADGLAAGKGVLICATAEEADGAIVSMLEKRRFGSAGQRIVVEEFLEGQEASFMAVTDGLHVIPLASSQDHKPVFDGDQGPNTGGMGAYSPAPVVTAQLAADIVETILRPTVAQLAARGIDYCGVLYAGLMIAGGKAKVLEYNVRFGDPECQPLMVRMRSSLATLLNAAVDRRLGEVEVEWDGGAAACVVMTSQGYPSDYTRGKVIRGLEAAAAVPQVAVFHAGTGRDDEGRWLTAGGRVLGVTAWDTDVRSSVERAYRAVAQISWEGVHYRRDVGHRAMEVK